MFGIRAQKENYLWRPSLGFVPASFEVDTALEVLGEVAVKLEGGKEEWAVRKDWVSENADGMAVRERGGGGSGGDGGEGRGGAGVRIEGGTESQIRKVDGRRESRFILADK